jgi:polysaccharide pyruvyl transferase
VAGWFSFERMGATAGDLLARDVVCRWLRERGVPYDVALAPPFRGGVDWRAVDPRDYRHVVFVCGPFGDGWPLTEFLPRFAGCRLIGLNLSMLQPLDDWNPFDLLIERDSSRAARPDLAFLSERPLVPVAGLVRVHPQEEYGGRSAHEEAEGLVDALLASAGLAVIPIDTRLDENATGLETPAEVESAIARVDVVVTTRLHGLVLALKNGVPALAVDPIRGGAKICRQAGALGWPYAFAVDTVSPAALREGLEQCLRPEAAAQAAAVAARGRAALAPVRDAFLAELTRPDGA